MYGYTEMWVKMLSGELFVILKSCENIIVRKELDKKYSGICAG